MSSKFTKPDIATLSKDGIEFLCITDIAKRKSAHCSGELIQHWLSNRNTIEFLGYWESLYNPDFKLVRFDEIKQEAGLNSFVITPEKWCESTNAVCFIFQQGVNGEVYAQQDIALEFAAWISVEFKLYLIKAAQQCKREGELPVNEVMKRLIDNCDQEELGSDINKLQALLQSDFIGSESAEPELSTNHKSYPACSNEI